MPGFKDMSGLQFGRFTVIRKHSLDKERRWKWLCRCLCGNEKVVVGTLLRNGDIQSCGCFQKEQQIKRLTTHGETYGPNRKFYQSWTDMKNRCYNIRHKKFVLYGGKGIKVCDKWLKFEGFMQDMFNNWKARYHLDRINPAGNYEINNCQWLTKKEHGHKTFTDQWPSG